MLFTSTENPLFNSIYSQAISYLVISHSFDVVNKMARKLIRELRVTQNDITRICSTSDLRTTAGERQPYTFTTTLHVSWTRGISTSACRVRQFFFKM